MYSKTERELLDAYNSVYNEETQITGLLINLCENFEYADTLEERAEFAQGVIVDDCVIEFLELVAEIFEIDISDVLNEETDLTERAQLVRGLVNALSRGARNKALRTTGTAALGKSGNVLKGGAASSSVRSARAARGATTAATRAPGGPEAAANIRATVRNSARPQIPAKGQTSADSLKAVTDRGITRHRMAVNQVNAFLGAMKKTMKQSAAADKLARARVGTKGTGVRIAPPARTPKTPAALPGTSASTQLKLPGSTASSRATQTQDITKKMGGGLMGTTSIPKPGAGLPRQAPKPEWGSGSGMGPKQSYPKAPRQPGGAMTKSGSSGITTPGGAITKRGSSSIGTPDPVKVKVKDLGPTGRSTADKGGRTLKGDGVIDVGATTVSSRRTTRDVLGQVGRTLRNNKGKIAAGAAIAGGAALGLATGDGKKTASGDAAPTTPSTPPASKDKTGSTATGSTSSTSKGKTSPTTPSTPSTPSASKGKTGSTTSSTPSASKGKTGSTTSSTPSASKGKTGSTGSGSTDGKRRDTPLWKSGDDAKSTSSDKPSRSEINREYDRLRKKDPVTGIVKGTSKDFKKSYEYGRKQNERIYGKDYAKPKTPNPLMKGLRKEDYYHEISEYLISEGFASSEKTAFGIISGMSREWAEQIIESSCGGGHAKKKKKKKGY